jgi:hypothetical protein
MTLKSYLWGMRISAVTAFAAWFLVALYIDPEKSGIAGQTLFYASAFLFLAGLAILFFTWLRRKTGGKDEVALVYVGVSFRQGILTALLIIGLLIFQQYRILTWWDGALLVAGIFLVELYFLTRK